MQVLVYTKPNCALCDEALERLAAARARWPIALEERSIYEEDAVFRRYRYQVPVVVIGGIERLKLRFTDEELDAALAAAAGETKT